MTRFVITHVDRGSLRVLSFGAQARWTYVTREEAEAKMRAVLGNPHNDIAKIYGAQSVGTFEVREVECHESGDSTRSVL